MFNEFMQRQQRIIDDSSMVTKTWNYSKKVGSYLIGGTIGEGSFAKVKEGLHIYTARKVAVKMINKSKCSQDPYVAKNMKRETRIWRKISHRNIVRLLDVLETNNGYYLITELVIGSDMKSIICNSAKGYLMERQCVNYVHDILCAVLHLHSLGIIHRDLKIDNILLNQRDRVKLIDFGLSCFDNQSQQRTLCGSPAYAAPELLANQIYGKGVDVWSVGVNMYVMLTGNLPFTVHPFSVKSIHDKMVNQDMNVIEVELTTACKDLLMSLLTVDPEKRITIERALRHDWFSNVNIQSRIVEETKLSDKNKEQLTEMISNCLKVNSNEIKNKLKENAPSATNSFYYLLIDSYHEFIEENKIIK